MSTKEIINTENGNVVLLSEGEYNNIMKAARNAEYLAEIDKAAAQFEAGKGQIHDLIEVEDDEYRKGEGYESKGNGIQMH